MVKTLRKLVHLARGIYCFLAQLWLLVIEAPAVFAFMALMKRTRIEPDHPWASGEVDDQEIWPRNIVYRSPSRMPGTTEMSDAAIVTSIGRFLRSMVRRSSTTEEIPRGSKRRMPHAVNLLHGSVHYNGVFLVFDDFDDLVNHMTDRRFRRDLLRFGRSEKRELTLVFRNRKYDPVDYAYMVGCVRSHLPWFSNGNGPTKRPVLWGNMSPYPAINLINGAWMRDLWRFHRAPATCVRSPVDSRDSFARDYFGRRSEFTFSDRLQAYWMYSDVRSRGFRGQLFFTNRHVIEPHRLGEYRDAGGYWRWTACHEVPAPWRAVATPRQNERPEARISVVIPTLNEASSIGACIDSVRIALEPHEVIVVDAGSDDDTVAAARRRGATVISGCRGRGAQCRLGAQHAAGDILVFLHADTSLSGDARSAVRVALQKRGVANFRQRTASRRRRYRVLDSLTSLDSIFTRFGDQGIAITRTVYDQLGGMPNTPLFEDVHLLRKARRRGRVPRARAEILVSPRRFERDGVVPTLMRDGALIWRYYRGAPAQSLYARYYGET